MNIEEYRALKAQQESQADQPANVEVTPEPTPPVVETPPTQTEPPATPLVDEPRKIHVDGIGEVDEKELALGYMRTQDYTRKTQELARQRKEAEEALKFVQDVRSNPQALEALKQNTPIPSSIDPATARVQELETKMYDMMLQNEIMQMQMKYPDFEVREVLNVAQEKQLTSLEDAYLLAKSRRPQVPAQVETVDKVALEKEIRAKLLAELEAERGSTQTLISSGDAPVASVKVEVPLSEAERKLAKSFNMTEDEYRKWKTR